MHLLAIAYAEQQRFPEAEAIWRTLMAMPGEERAVLPNLGRMLEKAGRVEEAAGVLARAVELSPTHYMARLNLGACLYSLGRFAQAREQTVAAAALRPDQAQPWFNLGGLWQAEDAFGLALDAYRKALVLDPSHTGAIGNLLFTQHYLPTITPEERYRSARDLGDALARSTVRRPLNAVRRTGPLRVGLLSADFRAHSVGWFLAGFLPLVDHREMEITAINNGTKNDAMTERLRSACAHWHDVFALGDDAVADRIEQAGIDVLVDLAGMSAGHRLGVLARKPAPVQVTWLGYFGTTGLASVDWLLADPLCLPHGEEALYRERVWRLPHSRFCMAPPEEAPAVAPLPALRNGYVTLGSFQVLAKLNDGVLDLWSSVLKTLPQARLRIQSKRLSDPDEVRLLLQRLEAAGVEPARCTLLPACSRADYLDAHNEVDFILDSFPYTGGTTTCEALWMGVPTLTLTSPGLLGRQGEAHLRNLGLDDWIATSRTEFIALASQHASADGLHKLSLLRSGLRERCRVSPLFDNARFAADWTSALKAMHSAYLSQPIEQP
jgi:predicted O-linked N-acetylglucosamine transferase (SPINDLY family)